MSVIERDNMSNNSRGLALLPCIAATLMLACGDPTNVTTLDYTEGRLSVRPRLPHAVIPIGLSVDTILAGGAPVYVYVPQSYHQDVPARVTLLLHGSLGSGQEMVGTFENYAERDGIVLVAPSAHGYSWDRMVGGKYGADVAELDTVLKWTFDNIDVDPQHLSIAGFSDGATYSLLIGLKNGDLFERIVAFAPCPRMPDGLVGKPMIFIAQGVNDMVLPIDECSRVIVPQLRALGYDVTFREYPSPHGDGHYVTQEVASEAFDWLAGR
jgi:phospholipase/carboxylesterase